MVNGIIKYDDNFVEIEVNENGMPTFEGVTSGMVVEELLIENPLDMSGAVDKLIAAVESGEFGEAIGAIYTTNSIFIFKDEDTVKQVSLADPKEVLKDNIEVTLSLECDL